MKLVVSFFPHIHKNISIHKIMYTVILALLPVLVWSIYLFGIRVFLLVLISCITACITEAVIQILTKKRSTFFDGSALLTGMLLAFNIPVQSPFWMPVVGSIFAIGIAKQAFGGLGYNFINPALAGRAFLMISWPRIMENLGNAPFPVVNNIAGTITSQHLSGASGANSSVSMLNLLFGVHGASIGESSALLILIGGLFLVLIRYVDWRIPFSYIGTVGILMQDYSLTGISQINYVVNIIAGGLLLGAFFMATDYVTSPVTRQGRWVFGVGCGILTVLIRKWGSSAESVYYSILLMNCFAPIIERNISSIKVGEVSKKRNLLLTT